MSIAHKALQCPHVGCSDWAVLATPVELDDGAPFWQCGQGHHGPGSDDGYPQVEEQHEDL